MLGRTKYILSVSVTVLQPLKSVIVRHDIKINLIWGGGVRFPALCSLRVFLVSIGVRWNSQYVTDYVCCCSKGMQITVFSGR
jgi:hypothetical protein